MYNAQIRACNPLKLAEYLAAGRPIVSTSFPAMQQFRGLVQQADNSKAMIEALRASVYVESLPHFSKALQNTMSENSWSSRAYYASKCMAAL